MGVTVHARCSVFHISKIDRLPVLQRNYRLAVLWVVGFAAIVAMPFVAPIAQSSDYHNFSDARTLLGIPNFWNVVSNLPFLLAGVLGFITTLRGSRGALPSLRIAYALFFASVAWVCFGSGYYHWAPSNRTLVWDRLPMAVAFMAFASIVCGEHVNERIAKAALWPLIAVGVFSVLYWDYTESLGRGDLRLYGLVQFLSLALIALILWLFPSRLTGVGFIWAMFGGYALAKVLEEFDAFVYAATGQIVSGHALKHVAAAAGMYFFVVALSRRQVRDA